MRTIRIIGTGFEGRADVIKKHCKDGRTINLRREKANKHDVNAIAVYLVVPRLFGWLGESNKKIGYVKEAYAEVLAKKIDSGSSIGGCVVDFYAPSDWEHPRVSIKLEDLSNR